MVDLYIGPSLDAHPYDIWRWLDPATMHLTFWGESFDLASVTKEVETLLTAIEKEFAEDNQTAIHEHLRRQARCAEADNGKIQDE